MNQCYNCPPSLDFPANPCHTIGMKPNNPYVNTMTTQATHTKLPINSNASYGVQTYRDLLVMIQAMSEDQLDSTPTVYDGDTDEYYPMTTLLTASDSHQVLDEDHPYFTF